MGGLSVWPESLQREHQPNDWIIEWPNETACAAKWINSLHPSLLGIHCYASRPSHLHFSLLSFLSLSHSFLTFLTSCCCCAILSFSYYLLSSPVSSLLSRSLTLFVGVFQSLSHLPFPLSLPLLSIQVALCRVFLSFSIKPFKVSCLHQQFQSPSASFSFPLFILHCMERRHPVVFNIYSASIASMTNHISSQSGLFIKKLTLPSQCGHLHVDYDKWLFHCRADKCKSLYMG